MTSTIVTLDNLRNLQPQHLMPWMIYAPWRSPKDYAQRRIHQRVDNASKDFRGWRVSIESTDDQQASSDRMRLQKSFYFGTVGGFEEATRQAHAYRDQCEHNLGLVAWRSKKLAHLENAFAFSGIVLSVSDRAPVWIYRSEGRRMTSSIKKLGLRDAYVSLGEQIAEIENLPCVANDAPLPILTADQECGLVLSGCSIEEVERERAHSTAWAESFVLKKLGSRLHRAA